jgi:SAM-dependent methyltransferase
MNLDESPGFRKQWAHHAVMKRFIPLPIRKLLGGAWFEARQTWDRLRLLWRLRGNSVTCNVCNWHGGRFADDQWHARSVCPNCRSQVRHRMLAAMLDGQSGLAGFSEESLLRGRAVLHFAPERQLRQRVKSSADRHVTADYDRGDTDLKLDISAMSDVGNASFDTIIACDVLEHVPDDRSAFREIHRILKTTGIAILTVPQKDPPAATDEDIAETDEPERLRRFGQRDHVRIYGDDFPQRAEAAGFQVTCLTVKNFPPGVARRHVLAPLSSSPHPLATNHRRIYLCRKSG